MKSYWDQIHLKELCQEARQSQDTERLRELLRAPLSANKQLLIRHSLLQNEALSEELFVEIAAAPSVGLIRSIVSYSKATPEVLRRFIVHKNPKVILAIARHPNTPPEVLEALSSHPIGVVFRAAQKNPKNPLYVEGEPQKRWTSTSRDIDPRALGAVPNRIKEAMITSEDWMERCRAARTFALTEEQIFRFATDPHPQVRITVARIFPLSDALIAALTNRPEPIDEMFSIIQNPKVGDEEKAPLIEALLRGSKLARTRIAILPGYLKREQLVRLLEDKVEDVRVTLAYSVVTYSEREFVFQQLAYDPSEKVRAALALNYTLPAALLERLAADSAESVRDKVRKSAYISPKVLEILNRKEKEMKSKLSTPEKNKKR